MTDKANASAAGGLQALAQAHDRRVARDRKRIGRNVARAYAWATRQSREDLQSAFANLVALSYERKCLAIRVGQIKELQASSITGLEIRAEVLHDLAKKEMIANHRNRQARRKGAEVKKRADPVQRAKPRVQQLWNEWQSGKTLHRSGAAFGRFVLSQIPAIQSEKTIERWCREWSAARQASQGK